MLKMLVHFYQFAEVYAVLLTWVVLPLGYLAAYLFLKNHYGIFEVTAKPHQDGKDSHAQAG